MSKLYSVVCNSCQIKTGSGMLAFFFFLKSHYTQQVLNCKLMQKKKQGFKWHQFASSKSFQWDNMQEL